MLFFVYIPVLMYLFLCVSVLCLMFLCVIPVLCLWALLPELKLMMMMIYNTGRCKIVSEQDLTKPA